MYRVAGGFAAGLALSGCASATRGTSQQISIASKPSGAIATVSGTETPIQCTTPCVVQVDRSADVSVGFTKEGYEPKMVALQREIATTSAAGVAGNLLLGGVIGLALDAGTMRAIAAL